MELKDISREAKQRIIRFLDKYEDIDYGNPNYSDDQAIVEGIQLLLETGLFCPYELQRHAAMEAGVILPEWLIRQCMEGTDGN